MTHLWNKAHGFPTYLSFVKTKGRKDIPPPRWSWTRCGFMLDSTLFHLGSLNMQRSMVTNCTGRFWDSTDRLICLEQNLEDSVVNALVSKWNNSLASPTSMDVWYTYSYCLLQSVFGVFSQSKGTSSPVCDGQTTDSMKLNQGSGCTHAALPG